MRPPRLRRVARGRTSTGARSPALAAYLLFGLGYIGYMTFVISLLREERLAGAVVVAFFVMLGAAVVASSWLWAWLLQRSRGGGALALLNALVAIATVLPVLSVAPLAVFASGLLFGAVFLSLVASTTSLVRHNLAPAAWPAGIAAFTIVFAAGVDASARRGRLRRRSPRRVARRLRWLGRGARARRARRDPAAAAGAASGLIALARAPVAGV